MRAEQAQQRELQRQLLTAQVAETMAQADERKAKYAASLRAQQDDDAFYGRGPQVPGAGAAGSAPVGQVATPPVGGFTAMQISQQFGVPLEAILADKKFNGGKKIAELIDSRAKPNWQNINGNLVNTNAQGFQGGLQAGMSAGNDGRVTAWQPDGKGGLVVGAPAGALDTFRAYGAVGAESKPIKVFNPVTQREEWSTEANVTRPPPQPQAAPGFLRPQPQPQQSLPAPQPGVNGNFIGDPVQVMEAITQIRDPQERANAMAAFQEQAKRTQGFATGGGFPAGPSAAENAAAAAAKVKAEADAKAAAERDSTMQKGAVNSRDTLGYIKEARELFKKGPTNSGLGSAIDATANFFGQSTDGADAAAQLKTLSGWMVSNVPRMEGPQSNFDVKNYETMAATVGDDTKPLSQRKAALDTLERLQAKYAHLNADKPATDLAKSSGAPTPPTVGMVKSGYRFKGGNPADPKSWEKQ